MYQEHETKHELVDKLIPQMAIIIAYVQPKHWPKEIIVAMGAGLYSLKKRELIELKEEMIPLAEPFEKEYEKRMKK